MSINKSLTEQDVVNMAEFISQLAYITDGTNGPANLEDMAQHIAETYEFSAEDCFAICSYLAVHNFMPGCALQLVTMGFARTFPQTV